MQPERLLMFESPLHFFQPDSDELLDELLPRIDDHMLREIAEADYGQDVEQHLSPLKRFRDSRELPILNWHPREVLELIRWSEPDDPAWKPGGQGKYGHLLRAFACATLLRSYAREDNSCHWDSFNETAIQLADSIQILGGKLVPAGIRFTAWCAEYLGPIHEDKFERPFLSLALLSLSLHTPQIDDQSIVNLCMWIDADVQSLLPEYQWFATRRMNWLLSMNCHNLRNARWIELGRHLSGWAASQPKSEKATWVGLIGHALSEDS